MGKIAPLNKIPTIVKKCQNGGGTVGLITGCFDVLHVGHIKLFKWAKKRVDLLIVGLDSDGSLTLSKGVGRPIFEQDVRAEVLSGLSFVDVVFKIHKVFDFRSPTADNYYESLVRTIRPDYLITHFAKDSFANKKLDRAKKLNVRLMIHRSRVSASSTEIVEKIKRLN